MGLSMDVIAQLGQAAGRQMVKQGVWGAARSIGRAFLPEAGPLVRPLGRGAMADLAATNRIFGAAARPVNAAVAGSAAARGGAPSFTPASTGSLRNVNVPGLSGATSPAAVAPTTRAAVSGAVAPEAVMATRATPAGWSGTAGGMSSVPGGATAVPGAASPTVAASRLSSPWSSTAGSMGSTSPAGAGSAGASFGGGTTMGGARMPPGPGALPSLADAARAAQGAVPGATAGGGSFGATTMGNFVGRAVMALPRGVRWLGSQAWNRPRRSLAVATGAGLGGTALVRNRLEDAQYNPEAGFRLSNPATWGRSWAPDEAEQIAHQQNTFRDNTTRMQEDIQPVQAAIDQARGRGDHETADRLQRNIVSGNVGNNMILRLGGYNPFASASHAYFRRNAAAAQGNMQARVNRALNPIQRGDRERYEALHRQLQTGGLHPAQVAQISQQIQELQRRFDAPQGRMNDQARGYIAQMGAYNMHVNRPALQGPNYNTILGGEPMSQTPQYAQGQGRTQDWSNANAGWTPPHNPSWGPLYNN